LAVTKTGYATLNTTVLKITAPMMVSISIWKFGVTVMF
jgi:hypothetical protein